MLNKLPKTTVKKTKRLGRGYGSGKGGHTSSRGQKGQKSRGKMPLYFEGTKMRKSLIRRLPMLRGKLKFKSLKANRPIIFNLKDLNKLPAGTVVDAETLFKLGMIPDKSMPVKILGEGNLDKKLTINLPMSKGAQAKLAKPVKAAPVKAKKAATPKKK